MMTCRSSGYICSGQGAEKWRGEVMDQMSQREHQLDKSLLVSFELPESFDLHQSASRVKSRDWEWVENS